MRKWWTRLGRLGVMTLIALLLVGCAEREHRKMTVREEQREGQVEPVAPGEMIVE